MTLPLVVRIDADDTRSAQQLRLDGWREIEVLETWRKKIEDTEQNFIDPTIRAAGKEDMPICKAIAQSAFTLDRLHADPTVSELEARQSKGQWVERAFSDLLGSIFVSEAGALRGFIVFKSDPDNIYVDLLAVAAEWQGKGIAKALVKSGPTIFWLPRYLQAGTQSTNNRARRLYAGLGFQVRKRQLTFHK